MEKRPISGEIYRDITGKLYRVVTAARHAETGEEYVVYQELEGEFGIFVLPLAAFAGRNADGKERFLPVPPPKILCGGDVRAEAEADPEGNNLRERDPQENGQRENRRRENEPQQNERQENKREEGGLDAGLMAFLEAETYGEKLKVYDSLAGRADEHMLNTIAVSMDLELSGGSIEEQYDNLKSCLLTLERYECSRLR